MTKGIKSIAEKHPSLYSPNSNIETQSSRSEKKVKRVRYIKVKLNAPHYNEEWTNIPWYRKGEW